MKLSKIRAVVFDCDGVLFDTTLANKKFYNEVLNRFSKPSLNQEQFENVHMMTVAAAVAYLFPELEDLKPVYDCLAKIGYHKFIPFMQMEEGLIPLLKAIKEKGLIRGIATNRTNTMEKVMADWDLEKFFEVVVTAGDVKKPKPDPEQLIKIMDRFDLSAEEVVFIGDSPYDRDAAKAAGTGFIAFKQPGLGPGIHADSMAHVQQLLKLNE